MNREKLKILIREILLERESGAAIKAKQAGLQYAKFGRWTDPKTGKVVAKSKGDTLVKVQPSPDDEPDTKRARELDKIKQMKQYQALGKGRFEKEPEAMPVSPGATAQDVIAQRQKIQKMRQQMVPDATQANVADISPEWHSNFLSDVEDTYGLDASKVSPKVIDALFKKRMSPEDAAAEYFKIKSEVSTMKKQQCQTIHGENKMTESDLRQIIREMLVEAICEKWEDDVEIKQTGEHKDKSIEQLKREIDAIEKKKPFNRSEWSERMFAIRAKQGWRKKVK